ncbi:MAG: formate acetyltransferase [Methylococcales bacterium]|nr:formate acetyltransferase [Methylococcales bacterium]
MTELHKKAGGIKVGLGNKASSVQQNNPLPGIFPIKNTAFDKVKTLKDLALTDIKIENFPVVKAWRDQLFDPASKPEICDELPRHLTEFLRSDEAKALPPRVRRAKAVRHLFSSKTALVSSTDLMPGKTTTSFVGPVVYMDTIGYCIWPELKTVATRPQNPFSIKPEVAERLNREIFPFWLDYKPVSEKARYSDYDTENYPNLDTVDGGASIDPPLKKKAGTTPKCQELMERVAFYLSDKATCVSHTVPDWERLLTYGLTGLIAQIRNDISTGHADTAEKRQFLEGVVDVFEGAISYAGYLADAAEQAGNHVLAAICRKVPAHPAETLHEALAAMWICYHLLLQENTNFGLSIGRVDQLLNPYYLKEWAALSTDQARADYTKKAVELVCHFFLKCSDHVPLSTSGSEVLFAGSGSNQALTVGGTRYENGKLVDAVNDMTYIILKATELLSIRDPNIHARYHKAVHNQDAQGHELAKDVMSPYLRRICQVNILTRATPALHGDAPVVHSMANYYASFAGVSQEEALADAYDYASIGCIEQNSGGKHYGNTGSTLFVLPAVLELTLFGGKHRSDGIGATDPNLIHGTKKFTSLPLTEMRGMQDFIDAFSFQLDEMAQQAVQCNNYFGRFLEQERASPFLSGLFVGPTNTPGGSGAKFRDLAAGGAKYNSAGVAIIGLADVIDTFCIIDSLVFGGEISAQELLAALHCNFRPQGDKPKDDWWHETLERMRVWFRHDLAAGLPELSGDRLAAINQAMHHAPHYGAGVDATVGGVYNNALAVHYTQLLTQIIHDTFYKYRTHRGGRYLAGYWSMTNHAGFGMLTEATPNGRQAGKAFASGITPCPGVVKANGDPVMLLDHMLSVTAVNADTVQNGYTYNLSLTTRDASHREEDTELFSRYMKAFTDNDGVLVQMCVSSINDLVAADQAATAASAAQAGEAELAALAPYKDLMIRVAGYSAYYVTLSPQMRREIIERANFSLESQTEQHVLHSL